MRHTPRRLLAIGAVSLLFAACGHGGPHEGVNAPGVALDEQAAAADATPATLADGSETADTTAGGDGSVTTETTENLPVLATSTFHTTGVEDLPVELTIDVNQFHRDGNVVNLRFLLTNNGPNDYRPSIHLSDGALGTSADGISLIDYGSDLRYLTVVDDNGRCVCTEFSFSDLKPGASISITAAFPAPPDASVLDIQLGNLGTLSDIPLEA